MRERPCAGALLPLLLLLLWWCVQAHALGRVFGQSSATYGWRVPVCLWLPGCTVFLFVAWVLIELKSPASDLNFFFRIAVD